MYLGKVLMLGQELVHILVNIGGVTNSTAIIQWDNYLILQLSKLNSISICFSPQKKGKR